MIGAREKALGACLLLLVLFLAWLQLQTSTQKSESRQVRPSPEWVINARYAVGARLLLGQNAPEQSALWSGAAEAQADDRVRLALLRGELDGADAALEDLAALADQPTLNDEVVLLQRLYTPGSAALTPAETQLLEQRHGWFGRLALSYGRPATDPLRADVLADAKLTVWVFVGLLGLISVFTIVGSCALVWGATLYLRGQLLLGFRPLPDGPMGIVLFELLVLLLALIPLQSLFSRLVPTVLAPLAQFSVLGLLFWARWRLGSWTGLTEALGWTRGAGFWRELGAGLFGYVVGFPLLCLGLLATLVLTSLTSASPTHPIAYEFEQASALQLTVLFILASLGAPLVEETFFRGAFFQYLRGRFRFLPAALLQGLVFAAIHPQGWAALPVLTTIAVVFAGIREWRGSLVASMVAHALNNTLVMVLSTLLLR